MSWPRVLLVEDNPITRKLVRFALQQEEIELAEAVDARSAIDMATAGRPDLILQDLLLPDMDGFALAAALRQVPQLRGVPILAFSGLLSQLDEKRIAGAGFTDFVTKPIEPSKLVRVIRAHLPSLETPKTSFGHGRRIVLVDDDDVQRKLSVFKLARLGFDVVDAADGHAALVAARAKTPAAIITDAMMPGLDGFGLCAAVRQDPALQQVPIVMLTSTYVDDADRALSRLAGANAFVIRTPALGEMLTALQAVLEPSGPAAPAPAVQPPEFERERASRTMVQLERQAAAASSARQQCAMLSAELAVLNAISEAITQDTDIDTVLREILAACCDSGGVSLGALYLHNDDGSYRTLMVGSHAGWENGTAETFLGDGTRLRSFMEEHHSVLLSRDTASGADRDWLARSGLQSALVVPLHHKGDALGAMVMMSEAVDLGVDDRLLFAEAVGHQVSVALALTQAFEDTELAAQSAREQARLLQSVFTAMTNPIMVVDSSGRATTWNAAAEKLVKVSPQEEFVIHAPDAGARGVFHPDRATPMDVNQLPMVRALRGEDVDDADLYIRNELKPEGAWLKITARALRDEAGAISGAVGVGHDVTKERLANEQLMISDRMASIGMMAAGVGHEINNPLSAVVANLEMAAAEVAALATHLGGDKLGELADEIRDAYEAAQRVRRIAMDLKVFSSAQAEENGPIDVERVLESAVRMAWNQMRHRARLVKDYRHVPPAMGADARLGQVFLNLIVNAAQAIPEGDAERNEIRLRTRVDGDGRIVIDIEDTGAGIPARVMAQLFTPFVTTKPVGIGTGLGLSICQRLVNAMGGSIWAESTVGRGTVFHVALQPARAVAPAATPTSAAAKPAAGNAADILVVDDEAMLGTILRRLLKGHQVTVLTNAREALELIDGGARFDAILCDVMMPVMSGIEFYRALSDRHPDQVRALIFLTGGAFTKETAAFLDFIPNARVDKPFDAAKLRARVEAHLAERATRPPGEAA
jgi:CheY-like chemotaxis protein